MTDQLTIRQVAELAGVKPASIRQHMWRRTMPEPDDYVLDIHPVWEHATITHWIENRAKPGQRKGENK